MNKSTYNDDWHQDEKLWWNKFGDYMSYQWRLSPELNDVLRSDIERDYTSFLAEPGTRMLDLGCGSGWLSLYFANRGMDVIGVDLSQEQINSAIKLKHNDKNGKLSFYCADFIYWKMDDYLGSFDSVFVNAFLHHLPESELELIFKKIASVLKPGGKVFMYEPLTDSRKSRPFIIKCLDAFINRTAEFVYITLPKRLDFLTDDYVREAAAGYVMRSPRERPVEIELIKKYTKEFFEISEVRGRHLYSLGYAMHSMNIKKHLSKFYIIPTKFLSFIDKIFLKIIGWSNFSTPQRFILCSIKLIRK